MKKTLPMVLAAFALLSASVQGASTSASEPPYHLTTVSWVVATQHNMDVDDHYVTLIGTVTKQIGDEAYWFSDGTGSVRLDSQNFVLPVGHKIVLGGRIDQAYWGIGHLEVDVRHWHYAKKP